MAKLRIRTGCITLLLLTFFVGCSQEDVTATAAHQNGAAQAASSRSDLPLRPPALEFPRELPWLNVSRPLGLEDLSGKVVILDFWTYGCVNCLHVLADLKRLEAKYGNRLAVIGVHTPKFDNERNLETLRNIVVRYEVEHPVVNDVESNLGHYYGMRAWPTLVVIDPRGGVVGRTTGEGRFALLDRTIGGLLAQNADIVDTKPLPLALEREKLADALLAAPGKLAVSDQYVAISDALHHRILLTDHRGKLLQTYGGKQAGHRDGTYAQARFNAPQGLAFAETGLYVADTANHRIRFIDLVSHRVRTLAGNGDNGRLYGGSEYPALEAELRSPWALALREPWLYIAMAGSHQIWRYHTVERRIGPYAGSGREGIDDGHLWQATFSQPSGLSLRGDWLYVADAEDSGVRRIHLGDERVETLVGTGLFDFGDRDGPFDRAQLQHVLGIAALDDARVLIADTYNHKLKLLDLDSKQVTTLAGTGEPGRSTGAARAAAMNEPGGLAILADQVLIADTNNQRISLYPLRGEPVLSEWQLITRPP